MSYCLTRGERKRRKSTAFLLLLLISFFAVLAAMFLWRAGRSVYDYFSRPRRYDQIIWSAGLRNHLDPALIKAVIWKESRFNRSARGLKGEIGLMQIMPGYAATDWARAHRCRVPSNGAIYDPELNIEIGSWYLARAAWKYRKYKDCLALALCEYNAGARRVADWKPADPNQPVIDRITIPSTKQYVQDILEQYKYYKTQEARPGKTGKKARR